MLPTSFTFLHLIYQPTNALKTTQFMTSIKLLHASAYFAQNINDYELKPGMAHDYVL